jgi:hypothetical protein
MGKLVNHDLLRGVVSYNTSCLSVHRYLTNELYGFDNELPDYHRIGQNCCRVLCIDHPASFRLRWALRNARGNFLSYGLVPDGHEGLRLESMTVSVPGRDIDVQYWSANGPALFETNIPSYLYGPVDSPYVSIFTGMLMTYMRRRKIHKISRFMDDVVDQLPIHINKFLYDDGDNAIAHFLMNAFDSMSETLASDISYKDTFKSVFYPDNQADPLIPSPPETPLFDLSFLDD